MNPREFFHSMTDDQLAEWYQRVRQVDRLNALLLEEQKKTAALTAQVDNLNHHLASERDDWRADFDRLSREVQQATEAAVADRNRFAFVAEHLPPILAQWLDSLSPFADSALTPEFQEQRQRVRELLSYLAPFSS